MLKPVLQPHRLHGLIFDGATFLGNIVLIGHIPRLGDEVVDTTAGTLLIVVVLTQIAGAWWKKGFLRRRLAHRGLPPPKGFAKGFMTLLLFLHFILFTVMTLMALGLLGIVDLQGRSDMGPLMALVVGGVATSVVWLAGRPAESRVRVRTGPSWLEFGADGLLWVSVSLVTRIFWDGLVALIEPARGMGLSGGGVVLLVAVSMLYLCFYLPSRYLFLVEDYQSALTWVQVCAEVLPVVRLVIIG